MKVKSMINFHPNSLSEALPYYSFDLHTGIFINKHSYGFVLEASPLLGFSQRIESEISGLFKTMLLPESSIQFLMFASPKIGPQIDAWANVHANGILPSVIAKRAEYLKGFSHTAPLIRHFRLFVSYSLPLKQTLSEYDKRAMQEFRNTLQTLLTSIGLVVETLAANDLIVLLSSILCPKPDIYYPTRQWNQNQSLASQICTPDTKYEVKPEGLRINDGEFLVRNYSTIVYPDEWYLGAMDVLIGDNYRDLLQIDSPFMISYSVHICASQALKAQILTKGARVESQSNSILARFIPSIKKQADEWVFVRERIEAGDRLVRTNYQVALFGNEKSISREEQKLFSLYRSHRWELVLDRYIQLPALISMLPMSWGEGMAEDMVYFKRSRITLSFEPINLLPIQGEWRGTETPAMALVSRKGQIFYWNPFDNCSGNYNVCIAGRSGSGKSVFMQDLMTSILKLGGKVFVLDVGRSFEKTAKLLDGNFLEFSSKSQVCLNPFTSIIPEESADSLLMLKSIVALMASPTQGVTDIEFSYIEKAITHAWQTKGNAASISDVAQFLEKTKDKRAQDLATMIYPYTAGAYGKFFNGKANINFQNNLNVIELEELKERKDLQAVVVQIFILQITDQMFLGDRKTNYAIVFDEAWDMLRGKQSGSFIETLAQAFKKI